MEGKIHPAEKKKDLVKGIRKVPREILRRLLHPEKTKKKKLEEKKGGRRPSMG